MVLQRPTAAWAPPDGQPVAPAGTTVGGVLRVDAAPAPTLVQVTDLRKRYGRRYVVDGVSFSVSRGEIFGILGPNGAGKTTTVECIEGLRRPDEGSARVFGLDPLTGGPAFRERIGVQLQEGQLRDRLRVGEAVGLWAALYRRPADPEPLLRDLGLWERRRAEFGELSGGQKQRLFIALALIGNPEIAILDELTTGLDPEARRDTWALIEGIRARGVTVLLVTHFMDEAERLCDRLAIIVAGRVVALDTPRALIEQAVPERRLSFQTGAPFEAPMLGRLPAVTGVTAAGADVTVTGRGDALELAVLSVLAENHVAISDLRVDRPSLEDAYLALVGRPLEP